VLKKDVQSKVKKKEENDRKKGSLWQNVFARSMFKWSRTYQPPASMFV
jgi:hypothetical protein